jgi:hypothetical protein
MEVPFPTVNFIFTEYVRNIFIMKISDLSIGFMPPLDFHVPAFFFFWLMVSSYPNNGEIAMAMVLFSELNLDTCFEMKTPAQIQNDDPEGS